MRLLAAFLIACAGCESMDHVVSIDERRDNGNDFTPRVRRVSGTSLVRVVLFRPAADRDGVYDAWRREFEDDPRFDIVAQHATRRAHFTPGSAQCISLEVRPDGLTATIVSKATGARWSVSGGDARQLAAKVKLAFR